MNDTSSEAGAILATEAEFRHHGARRPPQAFDVIERNSSYYALYVDFYPLVLSAVSAFIKNCSNEFVEFPRLATLLIDWNFDEACVLAETLLKAIDQAGLGIGIEPSYYEHLREACDLVISLIAIRRPSKLRDIYRRRMLVARRTGGSGDWLDNAIVRSTRADLETLQLQRSDSIF